MVKDFHLSSLKKKVEPLVLFKRDKLWLINFVISYQPGMQKTAIADMKKVWDSLFPEYPFQYEEVGAMYKKVYKSELLQARLLSVFTIIALFICSMGLFGLALIITQQRTKEIWGAKSKRQPKFRKYSPCSIRTFTPPSRTAAADPGTLRLRLKKTAKKTPTSIWK